MPRLVTNETERLDIRDDFWIEVKKSLSYGDKIYIRKSMLQADQQGAVSIKGDNTEEVSKRMIAVAVVNWNVTDAEDNTVPVNLENVTMLDDTDAMAIIQKLNEYYETGKKV